MLEELEHLSEEVHNLFLVYQTIRLMIASMALSPITSRAAWAAGLRDVRRRLTGLLGPDYRSQFLAWLVAKEFTRSAE